MSAEPADAPSGGAASSRQTPPDWVVPVTSHEREALQSHRGAVLWFTGLSAAGKTTLSTALERLLFQGGVRTIRLDGDELRRGLSADLDMSPGGRSEHLRRVSACAHLASQAGLLVLVAAVSPLREHRALARGMVSGGRFVEVYVATSLDCCERRDPKGLYARARRRDLVGMTGIDAPYEVPEHAEVVIDGAQPLSRGLDALLDALARLALVDAEKLARARAWWEALP